MSELDDQKLRGWQNQDFWKRAVDCGGKCAYCDLDGSQDHQVLSNFVLDHLVPRAKGGSSHPSNLVLACGRCNGDKSNYDPSDGRAPTELTAEQRRDMIQKARRYVEGRRSTYYKQLQNEIRANPK